MNKQRAGALVLLVVGLYGLFSSLRLPMGKWSEPGAAAFPLIVSALLALSGAVIYARARAGAAVDWRGLLRQQWAPLQIVVLTGGFILALEALGYLLTASLYGFALLFWVSRYRLWVALGTGALIGIGSWYIFGRLFETPLPQGILGL